MRTRPTQGATINCLTSRPSSTGARSVLTIREAIHPVPLRHASLVPTSIKATDKSINSRRRYVAAAATLDRPEADHIREGGKNVRKPAANLDPSGRGDSADRRRMMIICWNIVNRELQRLKYSTV